MLCGGAGGGACGEDRVEQISEMREIVREAGAGVLGVLVS